MPCPPTNIAACLADPFTGSNQAILKDMASVAKTKCLLCGEQRRRRIKQRHEPQHVIAKKITESDTLLMANITRPCPWCRVHFQKSAREHRKKCLPLLQLCLQHARAHAHGDDSGAAAGSSLGLEFSSSPGRVYPADGQTESPHGAAEQISQGNGQRRRKSGPATKENERAG